MKLRSLDIEQFCVARHFSRIRIQTHDEEFLRIFRRRREPDLLAPNYRRRPRASVNRRFPFYVFRFAPGRWHFVLVRMTIAIWSAKLRPVRSQCDGTERERKQMGET